MTTSRLRTDLLAVATAALLVVGLAGCTDDGDSGSGSETTEADAPDRTAVLADIGEQVIVPALTDVAERTDELATATAQLCATTDDANLTAARDAWDAAEGAWKRAAAYRFGPAESLRSDPQIAYPVDVDKIEEQLVAADGLPAAPEQIDVTVVGELGADARGLGTVEQLLFAPPDAAAFDGRRCAYTSSAAQLAATGSQELLDAWTVGDGEEAPFLEQFESPGDGSMFADETEVIAELVNSSIGVLTTVADMYLGPASGATTETPEPAEVDAGAAHRALADVEDLLAGVDTLYGTAEGDDAVGLAVLVAAQSAETDDAMHEELANAIERVALVPPPMFDLDPADPTQTAAFDELTAAYDDVTAARVVMRTEIASQLGVTVSFSDADGDG